MSLISINPANDENIRTYDEMTSDTVSEIVEKAHEAHMRWRDVSFSERAARMKRAAAILRERKNDYGELMTKEMGKPVAGARAEAEKCAWVCDYYAENAERFLSPEPVETDATKSFVAFEPIGVVLAVMPWNFPFWQVFRFAAPAPEAVQAGACVLGRRQV